jgi:HPt (histidine-containing phosphotransfer) domain-containing protein
MNDQSFQNTTGGDGRSPAISEEEFQSLVEMVGPEAPEVLVDLLDTYLEESAGLVESIRDAIAICDLGSALRPAHSLKSSSASIGAMPLSKLCADLEAHLRGSLPGVDVPAQVQRIDTEFLRVRGELVRLREQFAQ